MTQLNAQTITGLKQIAELGRGKAHSLCWTIDGW